MSKKQIVKLVLCLTGVAAILLAVALGISYNYLPHALKLLPIPLILVGIALLFILKTTGTTLDAKNQADPEGGGEPGEEPSFEEAAEAAAEPGEESPSSKDGNPLSTEQSEEKEAPSVEHVVPRPASQPAKKNVPVTVKRRQNKK